MTQSILLFAAGLGTRMAPLTDNMPKPLVQVAGRPLIDHALAFCDGLNVVVNVHAFAHQIVDYLSDRKVQISDERDALLETGGGLKNALPKLGTGPVMTMNTDAVWNGPNPITSVRSAWREAEMEALLLLVPNSKAVGHRGLGDFNLDEAGKITKGSDYIYSGLQIIRTDRLDTISDKAFSMWALWTPMLQAGTLSGLVYDGQWCDVGQPQSIPLAEAMLNGTADV